MDEPLGAAITVTPAWMNLWARLRPSPRGCTFGRGLRPLPQIDWTLGETGSCQNQPCSRSLKTVPAVSCVAPALIIRNAVILPVRPDFRGTVTVEGDRAVLSEIMQIVISAVAGFRFFVTRMLLLRGRGRRGTTSGRATSSGTALGVIAWC